MATQVQAREIFDSVDRIPFYNAEVTAIAKGTVVKHHTVKDQGKKVAATTDIVWGVTIADVPAATWGTIQIRGRCGVLAGATVTPGIRVMADSTGRAISWTAAGGTNANVVGICNDDATVGLLVECDLSGPGVISQG